MLGVIFAFLSSIFREIGTSIGKRQVSQKKEGLYTMGFLSYFWVVILFGLFAVFVTGDFIFSFDSLPTLGIRLVLEVLQAHFSILAIVVADRSTFGFIRILTIPILLFIDLILGYTLTFTNILGIGFILLSLAVLFMNHGIKKKGAGLVLFTAINGAATISLFKYNITNFNSVEAEGIIVFTFLALYFLLMGRKHGERPFLSLKNPLFFFQSLSRGIGSIFMNFAYLFGAASVITTAKRAFTILASIVSRNMYFKEKHVALKAFSFALVVLGLGLIALF